MLEHLHDHIVSELDQSTRTDTIFVVVAVIFNLIALAVNASAAGVASASNEYSGGALAADIILAVFIVMTLLVNGIAVSGLVVGRQTRRSLLSGLVAMYSDKKVDKYYDRGLIQNYGVRYLLFGAAVLVLGLTAIVVPLVIRWV